MYRAVTLAALQAGTDIQDTDALAQLARQCSIELHHTPAGDSVLLNGCDITEEIRTPQVTASAHYIAGAPAVRAVLVAQQRRIAEAAGALVTEGRDQGTVVFPHTRLKYYLDATAECRAQRRYVQLRQKDPSACFETILQEQQQRDQRDETRQVGPLKIPENAVVINTSEMTIDDVVETLYRRVMEDRR